MKYCLPSAYVSCNCVEPKVLAVKVGSAIVRQIY
jgi:hypothetical protein